MGLLGASSGLLTYQLLKNLWQFFPNKKEIIAGLMSSVYGFSSCIMTPLADYLINKNSVSPSSNGLFTEQELPELTRDFKVFFRILLITVLSFAILSVCLSFEYKEEEEVSKDESSNKEANNSISKALKSPQLYLISSITFLSLFFPLLFSSTKRGFGNEMQINQRDLEILSPIYDFTNCFSRLLWGFFASYFGVFFSYYLILILQLACCLSMFHLGKYRVIYWIFNVVISMNVAGEVVFFPILIEHIFGKKNSSFLVGIVTLFLSLTCILGPIVCNFLIFISKEKIFGYFKTFMLGAALTIISFICLLFVKDKPVDGKDSDNESDISESPLLDEEGISSKRISLQKL